MAPIHSLEIQNLQSSSGKVIEWIKNKEEIVITENKKPIANVIPIHLKNLNKRIPGLHQGSIKISEDFDDPLPSDFWSSKP